MEGNKGKNVGQNEKLPTADDYQSTAVDVREKKFSDKRRVCSSAECRTFLGEANRNRKFSKEFQSEKSEISRVEANEKYLQDSYNQAFQKHVDNLTKVISQHLNTGIQEKAKTEVHIRPTDTSRFQTFPDPSKSDLYLKEGKEKENEEEYEDKECSKLKIKKVNVIAENFEEDDFFEKLMEPHPVITFNHVCTEEESKKMVIHEVKPGSRSPSPLLEVPNTSSSEKITIRPP